MVSRQHVSSESPYEDRVGFSRAVRVDRHVHVAGTAPIGADGEVDPDPLAQARRCWSIALSALTEAGGDASCVVRTRSYLTDRRHEPAAAHAHREVFGDVRPASTMLVVGGLLDERWLVEVELDAYLPA